MSAAASGLPRISLRQLRYFVEAAERTSLTQAAGALGISQSALTEAVQTLELETGRRLLDRSSVGVRPTPEGTILLTHARHILDAVSLAIAATSGVNPKGEAQEAISVGASATVFTYVLAPILQRLREAFPSIDVALSDRDPHDLDLALRRGEIEIACLLLENISDSAALATRPLFRTEPELWMAPGHRLAQKLQVSIEDLADEPIISLDYAGSVEKLERVFRQAGLTPTIAYRSTSIETVRSLVAERAGVAIIADFAWRPHTIEGKRVVALPLADNKVVYDMGLAWLRERPLSPAAATLIEYLAREAALRERR